MAALPRQRLHWRRGWRDVRHQLFESAQRMRNALLKAGGMGTQTLSWSLSGLDARCAEAGLSLKAFKSCARRAARQTAVESTSMWAPPAMMHQPLEALQLLELPFFSQGHYWDSSDYSVDPWLVIMPLGAE